MRSEEATNEDMWQSARHELLAVHRSMSAHARSAGQHCFCSRCLSPAHDGRGPGEAGAKASHRQHLQRQGKEGRGPE